MTEPDALRRSRKGRETAAAAFSNLFVYGLNGIYVAIPLYLASIGMTEVQTGYLMAINPLFMCFSPVIWGRILDRCRIKNVIMAMLAAFSAVAYIGIRLNDSFFWIAAMLAIYAFFQTPFNAVVDTLTVRHTDVYGGNYGLYRVLGTVGYGIFALGVTFVRDMKTTFTVYVIVALLAVVSVLLMVRVPGGVTKENRASADIRGFFRTLNGEFFLLVAVWAVAQFVWGFWNAFYPLHMTQTLKLPNSAWGWLCIASTYSEIPFFFLYDRIFRRISAKAIMAASMAAIALRFVILNYVANEWVLYAAGFLTGAFITVLNYVVTIFIMKTAAPQYLSLTQNCSYVLGWGIPRMLATISGGYIIHAFGFETSMLVCTGVLLIMLLLLVPLRKVASSASERIRDQ